MFTLIKVNHPQQGVQAYSNEATREVLTNVKTAQARLTAERDLYKLVPTLKQAEQTQQELTWELQRLETQLPELPKKIAIQQEQLILLETIFSQKCKALKKPLSQYAYKHRYVKGRYIPEYKHPQAQEVNRLQFQIEYLKESIAENIARLPEIPAQIEEAKKQLKQAQKQAQSLRENAIKLAELKAGKPKRQQQARSKPAVPEVTQLKYHMRPKTFQDAIKGMLKRMDPPDLIHITDGKEGAVFILLAGLNKWVRALPDYVGLDLALEPLPTEYDYDFARAHSGEHKPSNVGPVMLVIQFTAPMGKPTFKGKARIFTSLRLLKENGRKHGKIYEAILA